MQVLYFLLNILAVWQLNQLLTKERGPAEILRKLRGLGVAKKLMHNRDIFIGFLCVAMTPVLPHRHKLLTALTTWGILSNINNEPVKPKMEITMTNFEVQRGDTVIITKNIDAFNDKTRQTKKIPARSSMTVMDAFEIDCSCQDKRRYRLADNDGYTALTRRQAFEIKEVK